MRCVCTVDEILRAVVPLSTEPRSKIMQTDDKKEEGVGRPSPDLL